MERYGLIEIAYGQQNTGCRETVNVVVQFLFKVGAETIRRGSRCTGSLEVRLAAVAVHNGAYNATFTLAEKVSEVDNNGLRKSHERRGC